QWCLKRRRRSYKRHHLALRGELLEVGGLEGVAEPDRAAADQALENLRLQRVDADQEQLAGAHLRCARLERRPGAGDTLPSPDAGPEPGEAERRHHLALRGELLEVGGLEGVAEPDRAAADQALENLRLQRVDADQE